MNKRSEACVIYTILTPLRAESVHFHLVVLNEIAALPYREAENSIHTTEKVQTVLELMFVILDLTIGDDEHEI